MFDVELHQGVATVTMKHGRVNAMDIEFCRALEHQLKTLEASEVEAVILTGSGRVFSAGIDLKRWLSEPPDYVVPFLEAIESLFRTCFTFSKPLIAAINGHAIAGGCMVAIACDYRLLAAGAKIGIPELRVGVPLPITAVEMVRFVAANQAFQRLVSVGATYTDQAAIQVGFADEVVSLEEMPQAALRQIDEFRVVPPQTFQFSKRQTRAPVLAAIAANQERFYDDYLRIWQSPAIRDAITRYVHERL